MGRPAALVDPDWLEQAVAAIEQLARDNKSVTSEDLRRVIDEPENANHYGSAFLAASSRNIITMTGARPSRDKSRRGGLIRVWELHPSRKGKQ